MVLFLSNNRKRTSKEGLSSFVLQPRVDSTSSGRSSRLLLFRLLLLGKFWQHFRVLGLKEDATRTTTEDQVQREPHHAIEDAASQKSLRQPESVEGASSKGPLLGHATTTQDEEYEETSALAYLQVQTTREWAKPATHAAGGNQPAAKAKAGGGKAHHHPWDGVYADPNHPGGSRTITVTGEIGKIKDKEGFKMNILVVDKPNTPAVACTGVLSHDSFTAYLDLSPKGGPQYLEAKFTPRFLGKSLIFTADGNEWHSRFPWFQNLLKILALILTPLFFIAPGEPFIRWWRGRHDGSYVFDLAPTPLFGALIHTNFQLVLMAIRGDVMEGLILNVIGYFFSAFYMCVYPICMHKEIFGKLYYVEAVIAVILAVFLWLSYGLMDKGAIRNANYESRWLDFLRVSGNISGILMLAAPIAVIVQAIRDHNSKYFGPLFMNVVAIGMTLCWTLNGFIYYKDFGIWVHNSIGFIVQTVTLFMRLYVVDVPGSRVTLADAEEDEKAAGLESTHLVAGTTTTADETGNSATRRSGGSANERDD